MIASVDRLFTVPVQRDPLGVHRTGGGTSGGNGADVGQVLAMLGDLLVGQRPSIAGWSRSNVGWTS